MKIYSGELNIKGFKMIEEGPLPILREIDEHEPVNCLANVPERIRAEMGNYSSFRVLPYKMQNHYHRSTERISLKTIILENNVIKATFLPEFGGRLYSLFNKPLNKELLSVNPYFQPANLALRNAWFSGGIEWNMAHFGHSFLTCSPVFFAECLDEEGNKFLRMFEYERVKELFYQIDFHLPEGCEQLVAYTKIINPHEEAIPLYYWSNTAVSELKNARVFSEAKEVVYVQPQAVVEGKTENAFAFGNLPFLEGVEGDASYPRNFERASEYFFQTSSENKYPWESVGYEDGSLFYECSTMPLRYRKMFCWGIHRGGVKWQNYMNHGDGERYVEIQAGLFPTQLHSEKISSKSAIEFIQVFGMMGNVSTKNLYGEFAQSRDYVKKLIFRQLDDKYFEAWEKRTSLAGYKQPVSYLSYGSGWGALEIKRMHYEKRDVDLGGMVFPEDSLGEEQAYWLDCLERKQRKQETMDLNKQPMSYMASLKWLPYLKAIIEESKTIDERAVINSGLILSENHKDSEAIELMLMLEPKEPSVIYRRTLGAIYKKIKQLVKAEVEYCKAYEQLGKVELAYGQEDFIVEYLMLLFENRSLETIWTIYEKMLGEGKLITEEMYSIIGRVAIEKGEWQVLDTIFKINPERIREGHNIFCELWFRKKAKELGQSVDEVRNRMEPPENIDFRMF